MAYNTTEDEAKKPFLEKPTPTDTNKSGTNPKVQNADQTRQVTRPLMSPRLVLFHISLVALYTLFSAFTIYALRHDTSLGNLMKYKIPSWLPDADLHTVPTVFHDTSLGNSMKFKTPGWLPDADLHTVPTVFHDAITSDSVYAGPGPNNTIDAAWTALLEPSHMVVSYRELTLAGLYPRADVELPPFECNDVGRERDRYLVQLDAFHELHCLKSLREYVYASTYHAGRSDSSMKRLQHEADLCVEVLRQRVMCAPDMSLKALFWVDGEVKPVLDSARSVRECVDWAGLIGSLKDRVVTNEELRRLKH